MFERKEYIQLWIEIFDRAEYGWGHGKAKKALIEPVISAYCDYALEKGVDQSFVDEVRKACMAELDAIFYTNEKVIIEKLEALYDKIHNSKSLIDSFKAVNITFGI